MIMRPVLNIVVLSYSWDIQRQMSGRFGHKGLFQIRAEWVIEIWEALF